MSHQDMMLWIATHAQEITDNANLHDGSLKSCSAGLVCTGAKLAVQYEANDIAFALAMIGLTESFNIYMRHRLDG